MGNYLNKEPTKTKMKPITKIMFQMMLLFLLMLPLATAADLYFFYSPGCLFCAKEELFLTEMQDKYPELNVSSFNIRENNELLQNLAKVYSTEISHVPITFINDKSIIGFSEETGKKIEGEIQNCIKNSCDSPLKKLSEAQSTLQKLTIPAVIAAAIVDSINPCEFAVLIILLTTILASGSRKKALFAGLAFTLAVYISYLLMGIGLYSALKMSGVTHTFYWIVAVLAIVLGLFNLKDYLWYGRWFIMEVPLSWRPIMKSFIKRVTSVFGAFVIGFLVSIFLLPCTSGPYIVILGLLAKTVTKDYALWLLILYNLIFILPMLLITFAVFFGFTTTEKAEEWRTKRLKTLHLIAGIILMLMGIGMILAIIY